MRPGLTISTAFHALLLAWGLIQFSSVKPREAQPVESLPIDLVSDVTKTKVSSTDRFLVFEVCLSDEDGNDVNVPSLRLKFR